MAVVIEEDRKAFGVTRMAASAKLNSLPPMLHAWQNVANVANAVKARWGVITKVVPITVAVMAAA